MNPSKTTVTKDQILSTAEKLISNGTPPEKLTARRIAEEAGTAPSMLIYHFKSVEALLEQAGANVFIHQARDLNDPSLSIFQRLMDIGDFAMSLGPIGRFLVRRSLAENPFTVCNLLLPALREAFPNLEEKILRRKVFEFAVLLQAGYVHREALAEFTGVDIRLASHRQELWRTWLESFSE